MWSWLFLFLFGSCLKEVKIFRGIVLSSLGPILGRKNKNKGERDQKKKPSVFRKISRACFCLIPSVWLSFRNNCLSLSLLVPSFLFSPLNFLPMTHFRFQVTCYADKYLTSLWAIVWLKKRGLDGGVMDSFCCCHEIRKSLRRRTSVMEMCVFLYIRLGQKSVTCDYTILVQHCLSAPYSPLFSL